MPVFEFSHLVGDLRRISTGSHLADSLRLYVLTLLNISCTLLNGYFKIRVSLSCTVSGTLALVWST